MDRTIVVTLVVCALFLGTLFVMDTGTSEVEIRGKWQEVRINVNPYDDVVWDQWGQYKANYHTHTTNTDGSLSPAQVIDLYSHGNYTILSITDHNCITWPWNSYGKNPAGLGMLAVRGNEFSNSHHCNGFHNFTLTSPACEYTALNDVQTQGGKAEMNHPGRYNDTSDWPYYKNLYETYPELVGLEVLNQGDRYSNDRKLWDKINENTYPDTPVWGISNDDFHHIQHRYRNYNFMLMEEKTHKDLNTSWETGAFYFCYEPGGTGWALTPRIYGMDFTNTTITLTAANWTNIQWIGPGTTVVGNGASFNYSAYDGLFVRAVLTNPNGTTYTQPWGFEKVTVTSPRVPSNPFPANGTRDVVLSPSLSVDIVHDGGIATDVSFFNASDDSFIGSDNSVANDTTASVTWSGLDHGRWYSWYAEVSDGTFIVRSPVFTFRTNDTTLPRPPTGLTVAWDATHFSNVLNWTLSPDDGAGRNDVAAYNIYRANLEVGPWLTLHTSVLAGVDNYTDPGAGETDGTKWWYVVRAVDDGGLEEKNTFVGEEPPFNDAPELAGTFTHQVNMLEDDPPLDVDLGALVVDDDPVNLTFKFWDGDSWENGYDGNNISVAKNGSLGVIISIEPNGHGTESFLVNCTDSFDEFVQFEVEVVIGPVNDIPTWDKFGEVSLVFGQVLEVAVDEDELYEFELNAVDVDGDELEFSCNLTTNPRFSLALNGSLSFAPIQEDVGLGVPYTLLHVQMDVSDGVETNSTFIVFNISNVNEAPDEPGLSSTIIDEDAVQPGDNNLTVNFTITAPFDRDGDMEFQYRVSFGDGKKHIVEYTEDAVVYLMHEYAEAGIYDITVNVLDRGGLLNTTILEDLNVTNPIIVTDGTEGGTTNGTDGNTTDGNGTDGGGGINDGANTTTPQEEVDPVMFYTLVCLATFVLFVTILVAVLAIAVFMMKRRNKEPETHQGPIVKQTYPDLEAQDQMEQQMQGGEVPDPVQPMEYSAPPVEPQAQYPGYETPAQYPGYETPTPQPAVGYQEAVQPMEYQEARPPVETMQEPEALAPMEPVVGEMPVEEAPPVEGEYLQEQV